MCKGKSKRERNEGGGHHQVIKRHILTFVFIVKKSDGVGRWFSRQMAKTTLLQGVATCAAYRHHPTGEILVPYWHLNSVSINLSSLRGLAVLRSVSKRTC